LNPGIGDRSGCWGRLPEQTPYPPADAGWTDLHRARTASADPV